MCLWSTSQKIVPQNPILEQYCHPRGKFLDDFLMVHIFASEDSKRQPNRQFTDDFLIRFRKLRDFSSESACASLPHFLKKCYRRTPVVIYDILSMWIFRGNSTFTLFRWFLNKFSRLGGVSLITSYHGQKRLFRKWQLGVKKKRKACSTESG